MAAATGPARGSRIENCISAVTTATHASGTVICSGHRPPGRASVPASPICRKCLGSRGRSPAQCLERRVIQQQQAQRNREQVEEAIVAGEHDHHLEDTPAQARQLPQPAGRKDQERNGQLDGEHDDGGAAFCAQAGSCCAYQPIQVGSGWVS